MADRLSSLDTSFLYMEDHTTVMHVGSVMVFTPVKGRIDYDRLARLIARRVVHLPRYRQRIRWIPGHLANPVWVDDENFDLSYHVRRAGLPKPGDDAQLEEFVARVQPRRLDRHRPLWEIYVVDGLSGGRFAIVTKTHHALIDGVDALDIGHLLVREEPGWDEGAGVDHWAPRRPPSSLTLVRQAVFDNVRAPGTLVDAVRGGMHEVQEVSGKVMAGMGSLLSTVARGAARPAPELPLNAVVGPNRRFMLVPTDLADYRAVRTRLSRTGKVDVSVNDVILATIAGAFRAWLLTRGEPVHNGSVVRALVPVSMQEEHGPGLDQLAACLVDLPVGEPGALMRLHQIGYSMRQQIAGGHAVGADELVDLAGFAPPTLHAMGARLGSNMSHRLFNVIVTNVPGPQYPLYAGDAQMVATYPVIPLAKNQALSIGLTSYDGGVYYGLNADRDAMPDVEVLGQSLVDSLVELVDRPVAVP
ncbi:MAG: wax ester/triacylglycerol synthase family O-acyltransferase [Dermatophilaceae bacterium]